MPRIRAIKPEFWSSPNLPDDPWARLLYIAMWNWADDAGVGEANMRELAAFAFPNDPQVDDGAVRRMCADIARTFGCKFYTVRGRPYYSIPNWDKHQKMDRRRGGKYPGPEHADDKGEHQDTARCAVSALTSPRAVSAGTGEQGNRGTDLSPHHADADALIETPQPAVASAAKKPSSNYPEEFERFWSAYPLKKDKGHALTAWRKATRQASNDDIIAGAIRYRDDPTRKPDMTKYAEGWLNGQRWLDEYQQPAQPAEEWMQ